MILKVIFWLGGIFSFTGAILGVTAFIQPEPPAGAPPDGAPPAGSPPADAPPAGSPPAGGAPDGSPPAGA
tara:strand:+ start:4266 stop:4475 length:210 start_codon:yes stop_codon:yes gene_type:complete